MVVTEQLTTAGWVMLGISAAVGVSVVALAFFAPSRRRALAWADRYGLELTEGNRPLIARYIRRTRSLRAIGGATGWLAPMVFVSFTNRPFPLGGNSLAPAPLADHAETVNRGDGRLQEKADSNIRSWSTKCSA